MPEPAAAEHIRSYYSATLNDATPYPMLEGDVDADVCVIGGGFSGVATALTLAERGITNVVLLEANRIGWGASGRNGGQLIGGIESQKRLRRAWGPLAADIFARLRYRGHEIIDERIERYRIDCDLKRGAITAATKPSHMKRLEAELKEHGEGDDAGHLELVDRHKVAKLLGTPRYCGGLIDRRDAHLHPLNLCLGEARAAVSLGVRIFEESPVTEIGHGRPRAVATAKGRVRARAVVIAGNAYHQLERQRLKGLLFPAGSYIIATEPLDDAVASEINPENLAVIDSNLVIDYYRLTPDKRLLFGGLCNYSGRDPTSIEAALRPRMTHIYPRLARTKIDFEWGGRIGIVLTRVPLIRRIERETYVLQGYSGHGIGMTHIAAEIVADAIGGLYDRLELFELVPQHRLPLGRWAGNQMLALGMAWYRMRDRFS